MRILKHVGYDMRKQMTALFVAYVIGMGAGIMLCGGLSHSQVQIWDGSVIPPTVIPYGLPNMPIYQYNGYSNGLPFTYPIIPLVPLRPC